MSIPRSRTPFRTTALVAGVLYLITFISIPTLALYSQLKADRDFITSAGSNSGVLLGVFLEVIVALAGIGTAVVLFPVVKRQNESLALGFVAVRTLEAAMIFTGALSLLTLVHLRQGAGGADHGSLITTGSALVGIYNATQLLGQTLMPCLSAFLLGTLLYRSGLVPRALPLLGLIGAPLLLVGTVAVLSGAIAHLSPWMAMATLPVALWELFLGLWLTFKGFRPVAITAGPVVAEAAPDRHPVPA
jgi:hypothetical protein